MNTDTLSHVRSLYEVDEEGIIRSLGRFEGEPLLVPYFYELSLDTSYLANNDFEANPIIEISEEERIAFNLPEEAKYVEIVEFESGFVTHAILSKL